MPVVAFVVFESWLFVVVATSDEEEDFEDGIELKAVYNEDLDEMSDEGDYEGEEGEEDEDDGVIEEEEEADGEADEEEDGEAGKKSSFLTNNVE